MERYLKTSVGRLRAIGFLEGSSLLLLLFVAMPVKYLLGYPGLVLYIGMAHGILFLLYVFCALAVGMERRWAFFTITWKVLLASIVPFGTFYVDRKILSRLEP